MNQAVLVHRMERRVPASHSDIADFDGIVLCSEGEQRTLSR